MIEIATTNRICEHLEKYVYDKIWNEPYLEYRKYTVPGILNRGTKITAGGDSLTITDGVLSGSLSGNDTIHVDATHNLLYGDRLEVTALGVIQETGPTYQYAPAAGFMDGRYSRILLPPYGMGGDEWKDWLPKNGATFFVYAIPFNFFGSLKLDITSWTLLSEYCNKNCTSLQVFTRDGIVLNRGYIFLKQADMNDCMLMAVSADMFSRVAGDFTKANSLIFGKYHDSDAVADNEITTLQLTAASIRTPPKLLDYTYAFYNGRLVSEGYESYLKQGAYIECVNDKDVLGTFTVPCTGEDAPIYQSVYDDSRLLVHIPSSINPNHTLITPNTCDVFLMPKTMEAGHPSVSGVYLYFCGREDVFHQITHNDFSISTRLLDVVANAHGFTDYELKVFVRCHDQFDETGAKIKPKKFVRDANYIDMLYNLSDEEITQFLLGTHTWQQTDAAVTTFNPAVRVYWYETEESKVGWDYVGPILSATEFSQAQTKYGSLYAHPNNSMLFWKASNLDAAKYADALIRRRRTAYHNPGTQCQTCGMRDRCSLIDPDAGEYVTSFVCPYFHVRSMQDYIDILGYFHVLGLVGKRIHHFCVTTEGANEIVVQAPLALAVPELNAVDYYPLVYHNGSRIEQSRISVASTTRDAHGMREITHQSDKLSRSTLVIPSNYATRLQITIAPTYSASADYRFDASKKYYILKSGVYTEATGIEVTEETDPADIVRADYVYEDTLPQAETTTTLNTTTHPLFIKGIRYYQANATTPVSYTLLIPGERDVTGSLPAGADYAIGDSTAGYVSEHTCTLTLIDHVFYEKNVEFNVNDTLAVEIYDNRTDGQISHHVRPVGSSDPYIVQLKTVDQWKVYKIVSIVRDSGTAGWKYEYVENPGTFVKSSRQLTIDPDLSGIDLLVVEGPRTEEVSQTKTVTDDTFGYLGKDMLNTMMAFPLDDTVTFCNNKRLIKELDYHADGYTPLDADRQMAHLLSQNLSYVRESTRINFIRTNQYEINSQHGFLVGKTITWMGQAPFWFDDLSALVVDGKLISNYTHTMGAVELTEDGHRNGAPYEIKTAVSSRVRDIVGCFASQEVDVQKILQIRNFFETADIMPLLQIVIPHSHKLYSTYLEAICQAYLTTGFDFNVLRVTTDTSFQTGKDYYVKGFNTYRKITEAERAAGKQAGTTYYELLPDDVFEAQFAQFQYLKNKDVVYKLTKHELGFVDVYPMYHRTGTSNRENYQKLLYMIHKLSPVDEIKHKDAIK